MWNEHFYGSHEPFEILEGKTLVSCRRSADEKYYGDFIEFITTDGETFAMFYEPDCCAHCSIEDICGDLQDLVGTPIQLAERATNQKDDDDGYGSQTWTFYKIATIKGSVTVRWYGASNGHYSEQATFQREVPRKNGH